MPYFSDILPQLHNAAYIRLYFNLEFSDSVGLPQGALLQLRREFITALKALKEQGECFLCSRLKELFTPSLPAPQLLREQVKSPPPGIVLSSEYLGRTDIFPGDFLCLEALFLGGAIAEVDNFLKLLSFLGTRGIYCGNGRFHVQHIYYESANGERIEVSQDQGESLLAQCNVCDFKWWLENQASAGSSLTFDFFSPLRLMKSGKPVFKPDTATIVEAVARRVSNLLAYHCQLDFCYDRYELKGLITSVDTLANKLKWQDWRFLQGEVQSQKIGGVVGSLQLSLNSSTDFFYLAKLGQLFNLGKSATYGCGQYHLLSPQ